ncbi:hypothetical protein COCON_G00132390 [Conger conger]|uniref:Uncharacterized protein n=1 Tax=Conger conger TaxID=82655 RepID=A0A9Q1DE54_CONCO|nr:hypothetical protein COCON_G00132390 [Conger conger]
MLQDGRWRCTEDIALKNNNKDVLASCGRKCGFVYRLFDVFNPVLLDFRYCQKTETASSGLIYSIIGMNMSTISSFHTQLASIVDVLAKAAVAEICEVVDNGYAVLHLEISRGQKENRALKRKLQMMELRTARGYDDSIAGARSANSCSGRVQICDELRRTTQSKDPYFPTDVWGNGEHRVADDDDTTLQSTRDQPTDKEKMQPESLLIKMERLEEEIDSSGGVKIIEQKVLESDGDEQAPIADEQTEPAVDTEELAEQHSIRHSVWEDGGLDTVLKAEPDHDTISLQDPAGRLNNLGHKYALYERPEMSRSQKEIESLKRKVSLQTVELKIAKEARYPSTGIGFNNQLDISPWRDGMPTADNDTQVQSTNSNESADLLEVRPQSVHIKKETLEEDLENNLQGTLRIRQERAVECDDGKSPPIADTDTEPAIDTEELSEQHSTRHSVLIIRHLIVSTCEPGPSYSGQLVSAPRIGMPCLSDLNKARAIGKFQARVPQKQAAASFGVSPSTISKLKAKFHEMGDVRDRP